LWDSYSNRRKQVEVKASQRHFKGAKAEMPGEKGKNVYEKDAFDWITFRCITFHCVISSTVEFVSRAILRATEWGAL
jgi:hypothetical protein